MKSTLLITLLFLASLAFAQSETKPASGYQMADQAVAGEVT